MQGWKRLELQASETTKVVGGGSGNRGHAYIEQEEERYITGGRSDRGALQCMRCLVPWVAAVL